MNYRKISVHVALIALATTMAVSTLHGQAAGSRPATQAPQPTPHPIPSSPILPMGNPIAPMRNPIQPIIPSPHLPFSATQSVPRVVTPPPVVVFPAPVFVPFFPGVVVTDPLPLNRQFEPRRERVSDQLVPAGTAYGSYGADRYRFDERVPPPQPQPRYSEERRDYLLTVPAAPAVSTSNPFVSVQPAVPVVLNPAQTVTPPPIGASREDVIRMLGNPVGTVNRPGIETLYFEGGLSVDLRDGVVAQTR